MTAREFASLVNAKEVKRGREWLGRCPSHGDKRSSLKISEGKQGVLLKCWSHNCSVKDICNALGIRVRNLFYNDGKPSPEMRERLSREQQKVALEHQLGLVIMLGATEKGKRRYWAAAERRIRGELNTLRCWLEPDEVVREWRERQFQQKLQRIGWKGIFDEFETSGKAKEVQRETERGYGIHGTGTGAQQGA